MDNAIKFSIINTMLEKLVIGDCSMLTDENYQILNNTAAELYFNNDRLSSEQVLALKNIIMICNILYNRTDMTILPIEDGFYDLLLEKYKTYDANFQVGSAVVTFKKSFTKPDTPALRSPLIKVNMPSIPEPKTEIHREIRPSILNTGIHGKNYLDFSVRGPLRYAGNISKRTHTTEHHYPEFVGTLDKCKFVLMSDAAKAGVANDTNVRVLERDFFYEHINKGIIDPNKTYSMIMELKYDGISVEADCSNVVLSARTRGDTGLGVASDITPILYGYPFKQIEHPMPMGKSVGLKFEAVMTKDKLKAFNEARGYDYANCRSAIVGLFGSSDAYKYRDFITLIPLDIALPYPTTRLDRIAIMNNDYISDGQPLRYFSITGTYQQCLYYIKAFYEEADVLRDYLDIPIDGIVVYYSDDDIQKKLGRVNYVNKYAMAVKFNPLSKITTFRGYTFEVGLSGAITPIIHYDPVEFFGTIHMKCTGSSLDRFNKLKLHYGDKIRVTYVNDVIPYVDSIDCEMNRNNPNPVIEAPTKCPVCNSDLIVSSTGKMLICPNRECEGRNIARITNTLCKLNLKGFGEQIMRLIGVYHLKDIVNLDESYLAPRIGNGNAKNFVNLISKFKTDPIADYIVLGALGFTSVASSKWELILNAISLEDLVSNYNAGTLIATLSNIKGIGPLTAKTINDEMDFFMDDIKFILSMKNIKRSKGSKPKLQIRFSGCRNKELEEYLISQGYDADSSKSVTKTTNILLIPYIGYESTKTKKLESFGGHLVSIDDFMINIEHYLEAQKPR